MLSGTKACTSCRSRQELSNEYLVYLLAKVGFDTAENEPQFEYSQCVKHWRNLVLHVSKCQAND